MPQPSEAQRKIMRKDFDKFDKDKSGCISNKELAGLVKLQLNRAPKEAEVSVAPWFCARGDNTWFCADQGCVTNVRH